MQPARATTLSARFASAVEYASDVHADQVRKSTTVPYVAHLLGVSSLVLEAGGDEDQAIAGLLHDAAEDHGGEERLADIDARFGPRVAGIVRVCSDSLEPDGAPKEGWERRKREHLARLDDAPDDALLVWIADKVHNGRAIVTDVTSQGPRAWDRFSAAPDRILWYYQRNLALAEARRSPQALLVPLRMVVAEIDDLASAQR